MKNEQAVVGMNDGCYTNGAAHDIMNDIADTVGDVKMFISTCISHCANNAVSNCICLWHTFYRYC